MRTADGQGTIPLHSNISEDEGKALPVIRDFFQEKGLTGETLVRPTTDYTRRLLAAVPVPDPIVQRRRREDRLAALAAGKTTAGQ